ncbi:MAG TPA: flagellar biosynthetic protein FliO [Terracidiphilus sp.]|nr:flagellar biosynthetic protein FliO [Terracidiphilus sp.]
MREAGEAGRTKKVGGLAGWLIDRLHRAPQEKRKLVLLEKMTLAPRQSLALIEAEGKRLLVATASEGAPVIYALDGSIGPQLPLRSAARRKARRISW